MVDGNIGTKLLKDCNAKQIWLGGIGKIAHQEVILQKSFR